MSSIIEYMNEVVYRALVCPKIQLLVTGVYHIWNYFIKAGSGHQKSVLFYFNRTKQFFNQNRFFYFFKISVYLIDFTVLRRLFYTPTTLVFEAHRRSMAERSWTISDGTVTVTFPKW